MSEGLVDEEDSGATWTTMDPLSSETLREEVYPKRHCG